MPLNNWPIEHCEELRRLADEGASYRVIAKALNDKFGTSYNRNATIGKASRMGIKKMPAAPNAPRPRRKRSIAEFGTEQRIKRKYVRATHNSNTSLRIVSEVEVRHLRCVEIKCETSFADVTGCRYAEGDGPFLFCNGPQREGSSYCEPHFWLCRTESRPKRDVIMRRVA